MTPHLWGQINVVFWISFMPVVCIVYGIVYWVRRRD